MCPPAPQMHRPASRVQTGQLQEALAGYRAALALSPGHAAALLGAGEVLLAQARGGAACRLAAQPERGWRAA